MIGWFLRFVAVAILSLVSLGVLALAGRRDPWWVALVAGVVLYVVLAFVLERLFFAAMTAPFRAKGAVLRGATVDVHSIRPVDPPVRTSDDEDEVERPDRPGWRWYELEATVRPAASPSGPFRMWAPGEIDLVPFDLSTAPSRDRDDREDCCAVERVEVFRDGGWTPHDGEGAEGEERLRLLACIAPDVREAKLRYYFEGFGRIRLA